MPNFLDPNVQTVTKLLKKDGYVTGHFGKWHLGGGPGAPEPKEYGVDDYRVLVGNGPSWEQKGEYYWSQSTNQIIDESMRFIEENKDRSFYVNVWTMEPHGPLNPPDDQMAEYKQFGPPSPASKHHTGAMAVYYAAVTNVDRNVGRLLEKLDKLGLSDNTVVMFSSDNGPEDIHFGYTSDSGVGSAGPFRGRKRSLYEGGVRLPFIVRWPNGGVRAGKVDNDNVVSAVDMLPTVCRLANVEVPADLKSDGQDMSQALRGKKVEREKPLMWEWRSWVIGDTINQSPMLSIREGKWKLLMNPDRSRVELYDIKADPSEVDNKADTNQDVVKAMSAKVLAWQKELPAGPVTKGASSGGKYDYPWPKNSK